MTDTERLIHTYFEAFNRDDEDALLATLSEDVVHDVNEGGSEIGKAAYAAFRQHMRRCYHERIQDLVVMSNGNRGAAEFTVDGKYLAKDGDLPEATGQTYSIPAAVFVTVADGKIARMTSYYNLQGWLRAIGA